MNSQVPSRYRAPCYGDDVDPPPHSAQIQASLKPTRGLKKSKKIFERIGKMETKRLTKQ